MEQIRLPATCGATVERDKGKAAPASIESADFAARAQLAAAGGFLSFLQKMSAVAVCYAESIEIFRRPKHFRSSAAWFTDKGG